MSILLICDDLIFPSRLQGTAAELGTELHVAPNAEAALRYAAEHCPRLVLMDLSTRDIDVRGTIERLRKLEHPPEKIVAFGPHVQTARLQAAAQAGADAVLTRGQLAAETRRWLAAGVDPADIDDVPRPSP